MSYDTPLSTPLPWVKRFGSLCFMSLGYLSCAHAPKPSVATSIACPPPAPLDDSWQLKDLGVFRLRLPKGFEPETKLWCEHGGKFFVRDAERIGYCNVFFPGPALTLADSEPSVSFLGARAHLSCSKDNRGNWSIVIAQVGEEGRYWDTFAQVRTESTAAQLITALLAAERPH
jgi:hypothetical protein